MDEMNEHREKWVVMTINGICWNEEGDREER